MFSFPLLATGAFMSGQSKPALSRLEACPEPVEACPELVEGGGKRTVVHHPLPPGHEVSGLHNGAGLSRL